MPADKRKAFIQHGLEVLREENGQVVGVCPFCGKKKFYLNSQKALWDCKVCGREGGFQTFLSETFSKGRETINREALDWLGEIRGLHPSTLDAWEVGLNANTEKFTLPFRNVKKNHQFDSLKMYNPADKSFLNTTGCSLRLFGAWKLHGREKIIWICEGEWDALSVWEALKAEGRLEDEGVVSVPGAGQWKPEWNPMFKGKQIFLCFDNDKPGEKGEAKVVHHLNAISKQILAVRWDPKLPKGFDARDFYQSVDREPKRFLEGLEGLLTDEVRTGTKKTSPEASGTNDDEYFHEDFTPTLEGDFVPPKEVYATFRKWLELKSTDVIDWMFGTVLANRLEGDPVWGFLVAPSGGAKSELLMSISDAQEILATTTLTSPSLISGMNLNGDPSLIPKLHNKVLVVKDFTTILNSQPQQRDEIFGILRDAYDGKIEKMFGNGVTRRYDSLFGVLAGTTPAIEIFAGDYVALGERFLRWREDLPDDQSKLVLRALMNSNKETNMRDELREIGTRVLSHDHSKDIEIKEEPATKIVALAQLVSLLRATVVRDRFTKEITHRPFQELGTRLAKQFTKLGMGISMFKGEKELSPHTVSLLQRTARSTVSSRVMSVVEILFNEGRSLTAKEVAELLYLPKPTTERVLEDLVALRAVEKESGEGLTKSTFAISPKCMNLILTSGIFKRKLKKK